jgi:quercetin dioxygenase-like cupin family protein
MTAIGDAPAGLPARPRGRDLEAPELAQLARAIAMRPELWRPLVQHDPDERRYASLHVDRHLGIWVISWMRGHDTGFHDHDVSRVGLAVAAGAVTDERPVWGSPPRCIEAVAGDSWTCERDEIHRMRATGDEPTVTIHAYSPPLARMGVYRLERDAYVSRSPVGWDWHLRMGDGTAA